MSKTSTVGNLGDDTPDTVAQDAATDHVENVAKATTNVTKGAKGAKDAPKVGDDADRKRLQAKGFCGDRVAITIPAARENEQDFVFVSVNGEAFQIPRGKPFAVPVEVIEVLDNAIEKTYGRDGVGRDTPRHSFSTRA